MNSQVFTTLSIEELRNLIKESVREEINREKDKKLMSFKETCNFLECSASALNKWKSENRIPFKKLGKRVYFIKDEIIKALKESNYYKMKNLVG